MPASKTALRTCVSRLRVPSLGFERRTEEHNVARCRSGLQCDISIVERIADKVLGMEEKNFRAHDLLHCRYKQKTAIPGSTVEHVRQRAIEVTI